MERVINLTILDITNVFNMIARSIRQVGQLLFETIQIRYLNYQVPIGDFLLTLILLSLLLKVVLSIKANNVEKVTSAVERRKK